MAGYLWDEQTDGFVPYCLYVLTMGEGKIEEITAFLTPDTFQRFGLRGSIEPARRSHPS